MKKLPLFIICAAMWSVYATDVELRTTSGSETLLSVRVQIPDDVDVDVDVDSLLDWAARTGTLELAFDYVLRGYPVRINDQRVTSIVVSPGPVESGGVIRWHSVEFQSSTGEIISTTIPIY